MSATTSAVPFENVADLLHVLGDIPPERVRLRPPPGKATERDLLKALARDDRLYELVDGTLVEKAMGFNESFIGMEIASEVRAFARQHDLGIVVGEAGTIRLLSGLVRIPDAAFVSWEKLPGRALPSTPMPELAPDLAVEVLRENNTAQEMKRKLREYFLAGVRLVWIIDPALRTAAVYTKPEAPDATLTEKQSLDGGDVLPGFSLPLGGLFARLPAVPKKPRPRRKKKR